MNLTITRISDIHCLIHLKDKVTIENIEPLEEKIYPLLKKKYQVIFFDMKNIEYIDSSGIGSLIKYMNTAKNSNIDLIFFNVNNEILKTLKASYLDNFFIIKTKEELKETYPGLKL